MLISKSRVMLLTIGVVGLLIWSLVQPEQAAWPIVGATWLILLYPFSQHLYGQVSARRHGLPNYPFLSMETMFAETESTRNLAQRVSRKYHLWLRAPITSVRDCYAIYTMFGPLLVWTVLYAVRGDWILVPFFLVALPLSVGLVNRLNPVHVLSRRKDSEGVLEFQVLEQLNCIHEVGENEEAIERLEEIAHEHGYQQFERRMESERHS